MSDGLSTRVMDGGSDRVTGKEVQRKGWTIAVEDGKRKTFHHFRDERSAQGEFALLVSTEAMRFPDEARDLIERGEEGQAVRLPDGTRISLLKGSPLAVRTVLMNAKSQ